MKLGIISDTHGSLIAWQRALDGPFKDADYIIHAGDVLYHGPRNPLPAGYQPGALAEAINVCPMPLLITRGNCDSEVDQMVVKWPIQAPYVFARFGDLAVMVTHGHTVGEERDDLAQRYGLRLFVSGHTHLPAVERVGGCVFLNPGSPALPKQEGARPTVAVLEDYQLSIIDLMTHERLIGLTL